MARAYKCDVCGDLYEQIVIASSPTIQSNWRIEGEETPIKIVGSETYVITSLNKAADICVECRIQMLNKLLVVYTKYKESNPHKDKLTPPKRKIIFDDKP